MRFPLAIFATLILAYAVGYYLTIPANPEVQFWQSVIEKRDAEIATVRQQQPNTPIIFFTGGSSTAFSIAPEIIETSAGIPCFNLGLPVSTEAKYLLHQAIQRAQSGDIIIVSLEHGLLISYTEDQNPSKLSFAFASKAGSPSQAAGGDTFGYPVTLPDYLSFSRPGVGILPTLIARKIINKPYRYKTKDLRYRGRLETPVHDPDMSVSGPTGFTQLSADARQLLLEFKKTADRKEVRIAYSMPWMYTSSENIDTRRQENLQILDDISSIMPVIEDGYLAAAENIDWFADSGLHLSAEGSKIRSEALAPPLSKWLKSSH